MHAIDTSLLRNTILLINTLTLYIPLLPTVSLQLASLMILSVTTKINDSITDSISVYDLVDYLSNLLLEWFSKPFPCEKKQAGI